MCENTLIDFRKRPVDVSDSLFGMCLAMAGSLTQSLRVGEELNGYVVYEDYVNDHGGSFACKVVVFFPIDGMYRRGNVSNFRPKRICDHESILFCCGYC